MTCAGIRWNRVVLWSYPEYKSSKARAVKRELSYKIAALPCYSPDLRPPDFLWSDISRRMVKRQPENKKESLQEYRVRPRKVATSTSQALIRKALANMHECIAAVCRERGQHIKID